MLGLSDASVFRLIWMQRFRGLHASEVIAEAFAAERVCELKDVDHQILMTGKSFYLVACLLAPMRCTRPWLRAKTLS